MTRIAPVAAAFLALFVAAVFIGALYFGGDANVIDSAHWQGYPMPPCFLDALHCGGHLLGSDENGRDEVARLAVGGSNTLVTALLALAMELALGAVLALCARRGGRAVDSVLTAVAHGITALPRLALALVLAWVTFAMLGKSQWPGVPEIAAWFGVMFWPPAFFILRSGYSAAAIVRRASIDLMTILLLSSTIEFFGYGHRPPAATWGSMLANAQENIPIAWWAVVFPAACIFLTVVLLDVARRGIGAERNTVMFHKYRTVKENGQ